MNRKTKKETKPPFNPFGGMGWLYFLIPMILGWYFLVRQTRIPEITWKQFDTQMLSQGDVEKLIVVNNDQVEVYILTEKLSKPVYENVPRELFTSNPIKGPHYYFNIGSIEVFSDNLKDAQQNTEDSQKVPVSYVKRTNWIENVGSWIFLMGLLLFFWFFLMRGVAGGTLDRGSSMFNFGRSKARILEKGEKSQVTFNQVAGIEEAKEEIYELVKFLKDPKKYSRLGAKIPKGILLVGPPGTGKTLLAKAVAGESGVPFFSLTGSEFIEMFVGVGAARMRDLFDRAKEKAPSIIFIDEIDTIGRSRGRANAFQANDERESTLTQLLAELDGFDQSTGVIVLAATNRGDILDPALLRPGRFDRHIHLELPNLNEREAIFKVHMAPLKISKELDVKVLALQTPGFSGADIANICNEGALIATRRNKDIIEKQDFLDAIDRVVGGLEKRSKIINRDEKVRIAYHEAGHVVSSWFLEHAHPILKVSIIPRGRSLGAAWYLPEEHQIITKSEFLDTICAALGGRASEEITFKEISSNALDDLEKVTKQAYAIVMSYGLGDTLRNISYYDSSGRAEQALHKPFSETTATKIDEEVQDIVDRAYERTKSILKEHKKHLDTLAAMLIEKEVIHKEELIEILGARSFKKESQIMAS